MDFSVALLFICFIGFMIMQDAIERREEHFLLYGAVLFIGGFVGCFITVIISLTNS